MHDFDVGACFRNFARHFGEQPTAVIGHNVQCDGEWISELGIHVPIEFNPAQVVMAALGACDVAVCGVYDEALAAQQVADDGVASNRVAAFGQGESARFVATNHEAVNVRASHGGGAGAHDVGMFVVAVDDEDALGGEAGGADAQADFREQFFCGFAARIGEQLVPCGCVVIFWHRNASAA